MSDEPTLTTPRPTADQLNAALASGATVDVLTYGRTTRYTRRHEGWFSQSAKGNLQVRHGRGVDTLSCGDGTVLMVGIRIYQ